MGIVVVPRCIGRSNSKPLSFPDREIVMTDQDERMLKQLRGHPSFLFFVLEGVDAGLKLYSDELKNSEFLIGGLDFPSGRMHIDIRNHKAGCLPHKDCGSMWITEVTLSSMKQNTNWKQLLKLQKHLLTNPPPGMVIPRPKSQNWTVWQEEYRSFAQLWQMETSSIQPPQPLTITGEPSSTVWFDEDQTKGVFLNPSGTYTVWK